MPITRYIKKYPNRRLYDTQKSVYISLTELADIIRSGEKVNVLDIKTGEDVTALVLTQILMNKAKEANALLPVSLLHIIIQFGEDDLHDFFENHIEKSIENYLIYRKKMDEQLTTYMEMGTEFSNLTEKIFKNFDLYNSKSDISEQKDGSK